MYKCGWNGCEKAYGTLNHLNAHVTMQSHGQKRTPEGMLNFRVLSSFHHLHKCRRASAIPACSSAALQTLFHCLVAGAINATRVKRRIV